MEWNGLPLLIFGTNGMSKEARCIIKEINSSSYINVFDFLGYVSENDSEINKEVAGDFVVTSDNNFEHYIAKYDIVGVVIPFGFPTLKEKVCNKLKKYRNIVYPNIVSPKANIINSESIKMGLGNVISAGVTLTTDIKIGNFNLINMNSTIGHDVVINDYCVINPQCAISGNVKVSSKVLIGAGVCVKQGLSIGENSIIGLGGFTVKDVEENDMILCSPAKSIKKGE